MRTWVVVAMTLSACDAGAKKAASPPPAPAPPLTKDAATIDAFDEYAAFIPNRYPRDSMGWLAGVATDAETHEPVDGVWIDAAADSDGWAPTSLSDETGHYRMYYPEGRLHITIKFAGVEREQDVTIKRGETTTLDLAIPHADVLKDRADNAALERERERERAARACPEKKPDEVPATAADASVLVGDVLRFYAAHPKEMMDWNAAMPKTGNAFVVNEVTVDGTVQKIDSAATPKRFAIKSKAEIQAEADRTNGRVGYLHFKSITLEGTCAQVEFVITITIPSPLLNGGSMECCAGATDRFHKGKPWTRVARLTTEAY